MTIQCVVAFGAQKTRTLILKNQRTQNKPLFGAYFCLEAVTVNGDRYQAMLNEFLFTKIEEGDILNIWFQQYGDTCHRAEATLEV